MNIKCPSCSTNNAIEFAENICCHKCKNSFVGFSFRKYKTSVLGTTAVLLVGAWGGQKLDVHYLEPKRYSTAAIYEIVSYCANPANVMFTQGRQRELAAECICALNKTMAQIGEAELSKRSSEFIKLFNSHRNSCY